MYTYPVLARQQQGAPCFGHSRFLASEDAAEIRKLKIPCSQYFSLFSSVVVFARGFDLAFLFTSMDNNKVGKSNFLKYIYMHICVSSVFHARSNRLSSLPMDAGHRMHM